MACIACYTWIGPQVRIPGASRQNGLAGRTLRLKTAAPIDVLGDPGLEPLRRRKLLQAVALEIGPAPPRDAAGR